jgi:hypothetical protein
MSSGATLWRKANPDMWVAEKERVRNKYANNPEYREQKIKKALERYYRLKAEAKTKET